MFLELIATFVAGFAGAGVVMLLNRLLGGRLPRWLLPVAAGAAMIGTTISNEYGWYGRTLNIVPDGVVVAETIEKTSLMRPWTYVKPYVDRFVAVDTASVRRNADVPDQRMVDLLFFGRWSAVQKIPVLMDCADARRAALVDGMQFDDAGAVTNADWEALEEDDPILVAVCSVP